MWMQQCGTLSSSRLFKQCFVIYAVCDIDACILLAAPGGRGWKGAGGSGSGSSSPSQQLMLVSA